MLISISPKQTLKFIINSNCCNTTPPQAAKVRVKFHVFKLSCIKVKKITTHIMSLGCLWLNAYQ